jgi:myosin heavy subunit
MEYDVLFRVVSSILHLGNISFYGVDAEGGEAAKVQNVHTLELAAEMLGVEAPGKPGDCFAKCLHMSC